MSIGIFLCECGGNIADVIDLGQIKKIFESEGFFVKTDEHLCSDQGYRLIEECIREQGLDKVVIAACSPMIHGRRFQDVLASAVNPNLLQIVNIREQCAWVHRSDEALYKAISLISGKVERVKRSLPRTHEKVEPYKEVAVIGGG
ncbi:MAG TPA: disulfide reductase, partial [Candidatus Methanoperedenaceae archaeon]|nr:disulfide reductase [Candidatus Methanoperedenaceae archaeon]